MSAAAREALEGGGYLVVVFAGEEPAMDPVVVSELPSLLDLLGMIAPMASSSKK